MDLFFNSRPVLLVPRFGLDDGSTSDFDVTLILATMTVSQLVDSNVDQQPASSAQHAEPRAAGTPSLAPDNVSNHTKIWSDLSGVYVSGEVLWLTIGGHTTGMHAFAELGTNAPLSSDWFWGRTNIRWPLLVAPISVHNAWTATCLGVTKLFCG
jgi:hypothetical protein